MFKIRWIRRSVKVKTVGIEEVMASDIDELFEECREELRAKRMKNAFKAPNGFEILDEDGVVKKTWVERE